MSSWDSNGHPSAFDETGRPAATPRSTEGPPVTGWTADETRDDESGSRRSPPGSGAGGLHGAISPGTPGTAGSLEDGGGGRPSPLLEWNASHDQMLIDAFTREGETPPSWLTNPNFALDASPAGAPLIFPADAPPDVSPGPAPPISWFDEAIPTAEPITQPHETLVLADVDSSLAEPPPSWLYGSGVPPPPEQRTGAYHRILSPRGNLPWVAAVVVVLVVAVGSAVALGDHSGSRPDKRRPVAIAGQTTTSNPGTAGPSVTGTGASDPGATTAAAATPADPAASSSFSAGAGASQAVAASGRATSGGAATPPWTAQPPPFTQAPPPVTRPPTTPLPPTTATTLPPTTNTTRPPRTITTPPPMTRPTLPTTSTTRPHS